MRQIAEAWMEECPRHQARKNDRHLPCVRTREKKKKKKSADLASLGRPTRLAARLAWPPRRAECLRKQAWAAAARSSPLAPGSKFGFPPPPPRP